MKNLSNEQKAAFNALVEEENQRIVTPPMKNVRLFFVNDTDPEKFNFYLEGILKFAYQSFMLLDEDYKPIGEDFYNQLLSVEYFQEALKMDINSIPESTNFINSQPEKFVNAKETERLTSIVDELNKKISGLEYVLECYLKNRLFFDHIKEIVANYNNESKTEQEITAAFIAAIKEHWNVNPLPNDFFELLKHNTIFFGLTSLATIDYISGNKTKEKTQDNFIRYVRQFFQISKQSTKTEAV